MRMISKYPCSLLLKKSREKANKWRIHRKIQKSFFEVSKGNASFMLLQTCWHNLRGKNYKSKLKLYRNPYQDYKQKAKANIGLETTMGRSPPAKFKGKNVLVADTLVEPKRNLPPLQNTSLSQQAPKSARLTRCLRINKLVNRNKVELPEPKRLSDVGQIKDTKYCDYHKIISHPIKNCFILKDKI